MAIIDNITDQSGNIIFPKTVSSAVIDSNTNKNLASILGDVELHMSSDSGKHVVESASMGGGYYIKYDDGTLMQIKSTRYAGPINTPWGAMFSSPKIDLGSWPIPFKDVPYITYGLRGSNSALISNITELGNKNVGSTWLIRPDAYDGAGSFYIHTMGFWRWK